jgi:multiple sugar transport system substrate-binding protein
MKDPDTGTTEPGDTNTPTETTDQKEAIYKLALESGYTGTYEEWLESIKGDYIELSVTSTHIVWKYASESVWRNLIELSKLSGLQGAAGSNGADGKDGVDGKTPEFRVNAGYLEWKYTTDTNWTKLYEITTNNSDNTSTPSQPQTKTITVTYVTKFEMTVDNLFVEDNIIIKESVKREVPIGSLIEPTDLIGENEECFGWYFYDKYQGLLPWVFNAYYVSSDITLYGFIDVAYSVTYLDENGEMYIQLPVLENECAMDLPYEVKNEDYTFNGWTLDGINIFDFNTPINSNITLKPLLTAKSARKVVKYYGWDTGTDDYPTLKREMINRWNETNEEVYIEIIEPKGSYDDYLYTLASVGNLPDVFLANSVPNTIISNMALDLTQLTLNDEEWLNVDKSLRDSITYYDKVFAIPSAQHYLGFFANYDLINDYASLSNDAENIFKSGNFSYKEFFEVIKQVNNINVTDGSGVVGVNATGDMINWLPSSIDQTLDTPEGITHFAWNGECIDYNGEAMLRSLEIIQEIGNKNSKYTFQSLNDWNSDINPLEEIFGTTDENQAFEAGKIAFLQAATYYYFNDENINFNYKFIGYPDGKVISAADYLCVSKITKNEEAAYEVAKYLSFGEEGIKTRFELLEENPNLNLSGLPVNMNENITSKWFEYIQLPGVKEVYEKVGRGEIKVIVEGNKTIPGYLNSRFNQLTGVVIEGLRGDSEYRIGDLIWDVCSGDITFEQYRMYMTEDLEYLININIIDAYSKILRIVE